MIIEINTAIAGCSLQTDHPAIAQAFISLITKAISPEAWLAIVWQIYPDNVETAKAIMINCLSVGA